jgi:hypothetical protein
MPLFEFSNLNKHGNLRTRLIYRKSSQFKFNPKGLGRFVGVKRFKYDYTHAYISPALLNIGDKKYIVPDWKEVDPNTTLDDINWIRPKKQEPKVEPNLFKFKSSSSDAVYIVRKIMDSYKCNCPGYWRSKTRECKHIKELKNK